MGDLVFWQTLLAGGAGGAITLGGQLLLGRQQRSTQVQAMHQERGLSKADRRDDFELSQLAQARVMLTRFMDALMGYTSIEPDSGADEDVSWAYMRSPAAVEYQQARRDLEDVTAVILDDELRTSMDGLLLDATAYIGADIAGHMAYWDRFRKVQKLLGERVRILYGDESSKYHAGIRRSK